MQMCSYSIVFQMATKTGPKITQARLHANAFLDISDLPMHACTRIYISALPVHTLSQVYGLCFEIILK